MLDKLIILGLLGLFSALVVKVFSNTGYKHLTLMGLTGSFGGGFFSELIQFLIGKEIPVLAFSVISTFALLFYHEFLVPLNRSIKI